MSLEEHLNTYTPLTWVISDEPRRVIDTVLRTVKKRQVFRMDIMDGFVVWQDPEWKQVLSQPDDPNESPAPIHDSAEAFRHVLKVRGVFIMENAHLVSDGLINFFSYVAGNFVEAFYQDDLDKLPAQFVLISCRDDKVPPEIARDVVKCNFALPTQEALSVTLDHVADSLGISLGESIIKRSSRAGLGMSEFEFIQACTLNLRSEKKIDPIFINHAKIELLKQGGVLEVRPPNFGIDSIGGLDHAKELIRRAVWCWENPAEADEYGLEPLRRVLLIGLSGSGKSAIAEACADLLGFDLAKFGVSQMMSKWVGDSENNMRRAFRQITAMEPICLWIDEFGRDMSGSGSQGDSGTTDRVHGEFLQGIQELPKGVFLICAANRIDALPPEMLRADRFDKIMFVGFPTLVEREEIFRIHLGRFHQDYDLADLARQTARFTGAEIKALIREVTLHIVGDHQRRPTTAELIDFIPKVKGRLWINHQPAVKAMYQRALTEWDWASSLQEAEAHEVLGMNVGSPSSHAAASHEDKQGNIFREAFKR